MSVIEVLQAHPAIFVFAAVILGLMVGSFLNVVIARLPVMMERDWRNQCAELLADSFTAPAANSRAADDRSRRDPPGNGRPADEAAVPERFNLVVPRSHCPHCGRAIKAHENIPLLSYLLLRGKCAGCGRPISLRYPVVEALSGVLAGVVAWHFGFGAPALCALLLTWSLIALGFIDFDHQLLPDDITLPFLWLGLGVNLFGVYTSLAASVIGAMAGYGVLWGVYQLFRLVTGKEGMGFGDFKLLAVLGAWMGWHALPAIVLLSAVVGAVVGVLLIALRGQDRNIPIPFGPYLAAAGWVALLWGQDLTGMYLRMSGLA